MAAAAEGVVLERITVRSGDRVDVTLGLDTQLTVIGKRLPATTGTPERIYLDLPGTMLGAGVPAVTAGAAPLLRVRAVQRDPSTVRVVLDLEHALAFTVDSASTTVVIALDATPAQGSAAPAPVAAPARAAPAAVKLFLDYRDFDLPEPPAALVPAPRGKVPRGHPPVLDHGLRPLEE
jgi:hypothetical protein